MKLDNQVAVLTGAASGIGRALAVQLAGRGCHLALVDRDEAGLKETVELLPKRGRTISTHVVDLSDRAAIRQLPSQVQRIHPKVHLLINNAGVALGGAFEQVSEEDFDWVMNINFRAVVDLTRVFLPALRSHGTPSRIVNISSLFGLVSPPGQVAYSASKFAVRGFTHGLRNELRGTSVAVTVVHPGGIATSIAKNAKAPSHLDSAQVERHRRAMNKLLKMPAEKAAGIILQGIDRDRSRVLIGMDALFVSIVERLMPARNWSLIERFIR